MKSNVPFLKLSRTARHLAGVLALGAATVAAASPGSVLVFGDSAADQGNLHATPGYAPGSRAPYFRGADGLIRLSDGAMWTERLFPDLHSINAPGPLGRSVNFAYGAATTGAASFGAGDAGELPVGVQSQVSAYLALRAAGAIPAPDASTYAFIEAGPNDYFAALANGESLAATAAASPARLAGSVRQLAAAGVHTIFVTETPDFGEAPLFLDAGATPALRSALRDLAALSRENLRGELTKVQTQLGDGYQVVVLPVNELFRAVLANPAAFGFTNVTGKIYDDATDTVLERDAAKRDGYFFVDSLHTTARAQAWQARYYTEVIGAIDGTQHRRFARVTDALRSSADLMHRIGDEAVGAPATAGDWQWFVNARGGRTAGSVEAASGPGWRSDTIGSLVGASRLVRPNWTLGVGLGFFTEEGKLSPHSLCWENEGRGVWLLNRWELDPVTVRLSLGAAKLDTTLTRDPAIPTFIARGETDGYLWQTRLEVERTFGPVINGISAGVVLGTSLTRSSTKAFAETGAAGLNLGVDRITRDSLRSDAGFRFRADGFRLGSVKFEPSADLLFTHEAGDRNTGITARLLENSSAPVSVAVDHGPRTGGAVRFALGMVLTERLRAEVADLVEVGSSDHHEHRVEIGLSARF